MTRFLHRFMFPASLGLVLAIAARAAVPGEFDFQGLLLDAAGDPVNGAVALDFTIFDAPTAGTAVWTESHPSVQVVDGVYSVTLGAQTPVTASLLASGDLHLEVVAAGETLTPRFRLLAVPYAVRAEHAETADEIGGVEAVFLTEILNHFAFDGGDPPNEDPTEGTADVDGDGVANFIDPDNDDDGIPDVAELGQGSDINLVTPAIASVTPSSLGIFPATLSVTGSEFLAGMTATFDGSASPIANQTPTSFDVDVDFAVTPGNVGPKSLEVLLPNGETATATVDVVLVTPSITSVDPMAFDQAPQSLSVQGQDFLGPLTVTFGGDPVTPTNVTSTSFDVVVSPTAAGLIPLEVTLVNGESDSVILDVLALARRVFLTAPQTGDLGGIAGADALCAARATELGFTTGTYLAWLGDSTTDPATRFTQTGGRYTRLDGFQIADDFADLTDGSLDNAIQPNPVEFVWTNVATTGAASSVVDHCQDWTSDSSADTGRRGVSNQTGGAFTSSSPASCDTLSPIYCFEQ